MRNTRQRDRVAVAADLRIVAPGAERRLVAGEAVVVGRDPGADIWLSTPSVSRMHARIAWQGDHWELEDQGSTNGIWVDDRRATSVTIDRPMRVDLGQPGGVPLWLEPLTQREVREPEPRLGVAVLAVLGVLLIVVGIFVLDWYEIDISGDLGGSGLHAVVSAPLTLNTQVWSITSTAVGGLVALLGLRSQVSRRPLGAVLVTSAFVTLATALYLMFGPTRNAQYTHLPGLDTTAKVVSLELGGPVTVVGAATVCLAGLMLMRAPRTR
jgi:hypothetical protein